VPDGARAQRIITPVISGSAAPNQIEHLVQGTNNRTHVAEPVLNAELFGHWCYEGPMFLNFFIRKAVYDQRFVGIDYTSAYLENTTPYKSFLPALRLGYKRFSGR